MKIRETNVVILVSILAFIRMLLDALFHLTIDLELAWADWEQFQFSRTTSMFFNLSYWICFTISLSAYFYRVWLFWFKSVAAKEHTNFGDRRLSEVGSGKYFYTSNKKLFGNPRIVIFVCSLWVIAATVPIFMIIYSNSLRFSPRNAILVVGSASCLPVLGICIILLRGLKNRFGVIVEYKLTLLTASIYVVAAWSLEAVPSLKASYYKLLIDFELFAILVCLYLLWLKYFISSYSLENYERKWDQRLISQDQTLCAMPNNSRNQFAKPTLSQILSNQDGYEKFRVHLKETFCVENLMFFEDVYIHRKSLDSDPFLELSRMDTSLMKECASLDMYWIDQKIAGAPDRVPSSEDIYKLYIKPLAAMEVNIPGPLRKELISVFEGTRRSKLRIGLSIQMTRRSIGWGRSSTNLSTTNLSIPEIHYEDTLKSKISTAPSIYSLDSLPPVHEESSIGSFYPAWKSLVNLLKNDSLVRFL